MPSILALVRERQRVSDLKASLVYGVSSRTAKATQRNPTQKKKELFRPEGTVQLVECLPTLHKEALGPSPSTTII